ncbi:MAG: hypothetical protein ACW991_08115 [Candidatus Hodarchaeales archaeon]|jgi:GTPase SAR1 family protein
MSSTDIPIKICVLSNPNVIASDLLQAYTGGVTTREALFSGYSNFVKEIYADSFHISLYLSQLFSQDSFKDIREKRYRGAIGVIYIFQKKDSSSFQIAQSLYNEFKQLEYFSDYQTVFLGILDREGDHDTIQTSPKESETAYYEVMEGDIHTFDKIIRSIISNSAYFQAMTQGSCDLSIS